MNTIASNPRFTDYESLSFLGKLKTRKSTEMTSGRLGVGFETLDRDMWDVEQAWPVLDTLGVKWARVQTGWAKCEKNPGTYDFAWLDDIVDKLLERGVTPWLSLSYGNPIYTQGSRSHGVGAPPIRSDEQRRSWQNFVTALSEHFQDRVGYYEIWNEPDLLSFWEPIPRASEYVDLVRLTVEPLNKIQPTAKVIGGGVAWGRTPWSMKFLEDCLRQGMHEYIDIITYHGYKSVPERHTTQEFPAFRHSINKYKPSLKYWQGESGVQSHVPEKAVGVGALSTMKFSEAIQARMLLRRFLLELGNDTTMCSYFHMADFAHYANFKESFHYGLVRLEDGSPKPSYYALQSLATLLADPMEPARGSFSCHMSVLSDTDDPRATKVATWQENFLRGDVPVHAWWLPDSVEDDPTWQQVEATYWIDSSLKLENPVLIDPSTQDVYAVRFDMDKRTCGETWMDPDPEAEGVRHFKPLPISNTPLLLTDRSVIDIKNGD
ncbi:MAG: GH39 family glycosyl hydrolase [Chthoniobacterales bacterium]